MRVDHLVPAPSAALLLVYQYADAFLRLQREPFSPVWQGQHLAPQDRFCLLGARVSTSQTISSCVVMRIGMNASAGLVSIRVTVCAQKIGGGGLHRVLTERAVP